MSDEDFFTEDQIAELNRRMNQQAIDDQQAAQATQDQQAAQAAQDQQSKDGETPPQQQQAAQQQQAPQQQQAAMDVETMRNLFKEMINEANESKSNEAINLMWQQQVNKAFAETKGFQQFMNSPDDYDQVRMDQINKIPDYGQRVAALAKIQSRFAQAISNAGGSQEPLIDRKLVKQAEDFQQKQKALDDKLRKGEYSTIQEYNNESLNLISEEMNSLMGN